MKKFLGIEVCLTGLLNVGKVSEAVLNSVNNNCCVPLLHFFVPRNTAYPRLGRLCRQMLVLAVNTIRDVSKIRDSVVIADSIEVVNVPFRPFAVDIEPCQSVGRVKASVNANDNVSVNIHASGNLAFLDAIAAKFISPLKDSSVRVVMEEIAQKLRAKIGLSHDAPQMLIGQRPAVDSQSLRASPFSVVLYSGATLKVSYGS